MMSVELDPNSFPALSQHVYAKWSPVLLAPISGSYERLVIGCAAANETGFHLEMANALNRLGCLYAARADSVLFAVALAQKALMHDLAERGIEALQHPRGLLSGVALGEVREAEGASLSEIARDWMGVLSSLYDPETAKDALAKSADVLATAQKADRVEDRLPQLVLRHVSSRNLAVAQYFNARIAAGKGRRRRSAAHEVEIDYKGRRLVANFATLKAGRLAPAVGNIKQRLWDLKIDRERDEAHDGISHELMIQVPRPDDPQISEKQYANLETEYAGLEQQADELKLILRQFNTPEQIGQHIVLKEAA